MFLCFMLGSCTRPEKEWQDWSGKFDEISFTQNHNLLMEYDPDSWQTGFSELQFSAMKDDMTAWFKLELNDAPVVGSATDGTLTWKTRMMKNKKRQKLSFQTVKTDDSGKIWLYNHGQHIGLVIGPMAD